MRRVSRPHAPTRSQRPTPADREAVEREAREAWKDSLIARFGRGRTNVGKRLS